MTVAVCFNCGSFKFGAFTSCKKCGALPESDDDLAFSMMLTDHFETEEDLASIGQKIEANGSKAKIAPEQRDEIFEILNIKEMATKWRKINSPAKDQTKAEEL